MFTFFFFFLQFARFCTESDYTVDLVQETKQKNMTA